MKMHNATPSTITRLTKPGLVGPWAGTMASACTPAGYWPEWVHVAGRQIALMFCLLWLVSCRSMAVPEVTEADKAQVVRLTLERALLAHEIPDYQLLPDKTNIILSTQNIDREWVPQLDGIHFILRDSQEIQARADREGDYLYLCFREIEVQENGRITVSLENSWAIGENSTAAYLSGGGFTIEYQRKNGSWVGQVKLLWIS